LARLVYLSDITHHVTHRERLEHLAYLDHLTSLYNRRGLELVAEHLWATAARLGRPVLAFYFDLDGLKDINDNRGHHCGDAAIREVADVVRHVFRDADVKARIGGDEFVVLVVEDHENPADKLLARIEDEVRARNAAHARDYALHVSVGIGRHGSERPFDVMHLLAQADRRMYRAKRAARQGCVRHCDGSAEDEERESNEEPAPARIAPLEPAAAAVS
jgi:diguanylate cyclase (GGDEF)-like protein